MATYQRRKKGWSESVRALMTFRKCKGTDDMTANTYTITCTCAWHSAQSVQRAQIKLETCPSHNVQVYRWINVVSIVCICNTMKFVSHDCCGS